MLRSREAPWAKRIAAARSDFVALRDYPSVVPHPAAVQSPAGVQSLGGGCTEVSQPQQNKGETLQIDRFETPEDLRVLVLTSPKAGSGQGRGEIPKLAQRLGELNIHCQVIDSIDVMRSQLNDERSFSQTIVVAAGGDGTLSLAASLVLETSSEKKSTRENSGSGETAEQPSLPPTSRDERSPDTTAVARNSAILLPMPLGTENLVAQEYHHRHEVDEVLASIRFGSVQQTDLGSCGERNFLIMATAGYDAEVVRWLHLTRRGHISRLTYLSPILRSFVSYRFPRIRVTVDGQSLDDCAWAMAFNLSRYGGGLGIEPDADGTDGLLDVILFRRGGFFSGLRYVWKIARGTHLNDPSVIRKRGTEVCFESDNRVPVQIDGDLSGELPVRLTLMPNAISLLLPAIPKKR
jgi:diacylglycerol kinase (ATP)